MPALPDAWFASGLLVFALGLAARAPPAVAAALAAFAWTCLVAGHGLGHRWPAEADGRDVVLAGWIDAMPERGADRVRFSLRVTSAATAHPPRRVRLSWYEPAPMLRAGQALELTARLRAPRGLANPGGFDYERWLLVGGYDATGYVRGGRIVADRSGPAAAWLRLRAALAERIARQVDDPDSAALIQALTLGERRGFDDRHWDVFRRTGTSHLVAVSGLHIGLIAGLAFVATLRAMLRLPYRIARSGYAIAAVGSVLCAACYAALAGFGLPTRRALVMLIVVQALLVARRRWPVSSGLAVALVVILVADPLATLTASFWLSFGAVALLLAATAAARFVGAGRRPVPLADFVRVQAALTLGLMPLTIGFFGELSAVSFFVNLLAIPLFAFAIVPVSLCAVAVSLVAGGGSPLMDLAAWLAGAGWRLLASAAGFDLAAVAVSPPPAGLLVIAALGVGCAVMRNPLPGRRLFGLTLLPLAGQHTPVPDPGFMTATVLDVGHGLAVAIETATHRVLYDAGPRFRSGFDAGAGIVVPALTAARTRPLDLVILSHGDTDHVGGASTVVARYPDAAVLAGADVDRIEGDPCVAGQRFVLDAVRFEFLHPPPVRWLDRNDHSCVLRIETAVGSMLLTGDIEARAEALLAPRLRPADVVVVPHHGSLTSSTPAFVSAARPQIAIVSAAHNSRWGFPRAEVVERWHGVGARVVTTAADGAVTLRFDTSGLTVSTSRGQRRRYWQAKREPVSGATDATAL